MGLVKGLVLVLGATLLTILGAAPAQTDTLRSDDTLIYVPVVAHYAPCYSMEIHSRDQATEYRLKCAGQHFLTVVHEYGLVVLRPHPGRDLNGWGSSWYVQPYVMDARSAGSVIEDITVYPDRIRVSVSGRVSIGAPGDYGTWAMTLDLTYDSVARRVAGAGTYHIMLDGVLANVGDLKLHKMASNYLTDVPLLSGGRGNTGDLSEIIVTPGDGSGYHWIPVNNHCPQDRAKKLAIEMVGQYNNVDSAAQGEPRIEPAYKPSLKVVLDDTSPESAGMIFCGFYERGLAHAFWADNVAVHAIVRPGTDETVFNYVVDFESQALADECERPSICAGQR